MGRDTLPQVPLGSDAAEAAALQHGPWRMPAHLSSGLEQAERFLVASRQEQGPWVIVAMGLGITLWFLGANAWQWTAVVAAGFSAAILAGVGLRADGAFPFLRRAVMFLGLALCLGCLLIWAKSSMVGVSAIERPIVAEIEAVVLSREDQPAEQRSVCWLQRGSQARAERSRYGSTSRTNLRSPSWIAAHGSDCAPA